MKYLSQRDSRWSDKKLGESSLTVGRYGCTTTCISMLSDYFTCFKSPLELASNVANYTKEGLIIWSVLRFENMRFVLREYGRNDFNISHALKDPSSAVILQVDNGAHWVLAVRKSFLGNDYIIVDPWDGKKKKCLKTYNNITGAAYFEGKAPEQPSVKIDPLFGKKLADRDYPFAIQTERHGELWYFHPNGEREYLSPQNILKFIQRNAFGISNNDLEKVKIKKI